MTSLRFCFLTTFYPPFNFGGDGIDVQRMARALVARGHAVTVIHDVDSYEWLAGQSLPDEPGHQGGIEVVGLRSRLGVLSPFLTHQVGQPVVHGRTIAALMRQRDFDVIVYGNVSLVGGPGLLSFEGRALKLYVAHEHWLVCPSHVLWRFNREPCDARACLRCVLSHRRPPQLWRYTGALERAMAGVDTFIARSEFSRQQHRAFGFSRPMALLPYFVPGPWPEHRQTTPAPRPHARPYFMYAGRLTRIKGLDSAIAAFSRCPDADLLIIGAGGDELALRAQARSAPNITFLGRLAPEQLDCYYAHAIATIAPSRGPETFGVTLIESFRQRTPVIARRMGPFPEIVDAARGGLLFSTQDEFVAAVRRLQQDVETREVLAASAYRTCRERWSEDVVIGQFLDLVDARLATR